MELVNGGEVGVVEVVGVFAGGAQGFEDGVAEGPVAVVGVDGLGVVGVGGGNFGVPLFSIDELVFRQRPDRLDTTPNLQSTLLRFSYCSWNSSRRVGLTFGKVRTGLVVLHCVRHVACPFILGHVAIGY